MTQRQFFLQSQFSAFQFHEQDLIGRRACPFLGNAALEPGMFALQSIKMRGFHPKPPSWKFCLLPHRRHRWALAAPTVATRCDQQNRAGARSHGPTIAVSCKRSRDVTQSTRASLKDRGKHGQNARCPLPVERGRGMMAQRACVVRPTLTNADGRGVVPG